jgi:hypothetical protein
LGLKDKHYSEGIIKEVVWLSGVMDSFEQVAAALQRVGKVSMSDTSVWRRVAEWGEAFKHLDTQQAQAATALPKRNESAVQPADQAGRMGVSLDGGMIYLRQEGWKEFKVGCVFAVEVRPTFDKETQEWVDLPHAIANTYVAHLGGPAVWGQRLWVEAEKRGWNRRRETQVVGDGSAWIWNVADEHFYDSQQVVDYYHAAEHVATAAQLLYPQDPTAARRWFTQAKKTLFQGHADQIAQTLTQAATRQPQVADDLGAEAAYFETNKKRMQSMELREDGYLIGSGMVESGIKRFKTRFCGPGMRWSRAGAERMLSIRAAIMSDRFDTMWHHLQNSPPN